MRCLPYILTAAVLSLAAAPADADKAAADACSAKLSPEAKQIYTASIASVTPTADLREVIRSKTTALVMGGKLPRDKARPSAEAAGECLKLAR